MKDEDDTENHKANVSDYSNSEEDNYNQSNSNKDNSLQDDSRMKSHESDDQVSDSSNNNSDVSEKSKNNTKNNDFEKEENKMNENQKNDDESKEESEGKSNGINEDEDNRESKENIDNKENDNAKDEVRNGSNNESEDKASDSENKSESETKKKSKKNFWLILSIVIIVSLAFVIVTMPYIKDYFHVPVVKNKTFKPNSYWYNGFLFNQTKKLGYDNYVWETDFRVGKNIYDAIFYFDPRSLENITLPPEVSNLLLVNRSKIYITTAPDTPASMGIVYIEIGKITGMRSNKTIYGLYNIPTEMTLVNNSDNPYVKQITCANATNSTLVIWLDYGANKSNKITYDSNCLVLSASDSVNMLKEADKFDYGILGIVKKK
ncbi:MAG: hypothetical protein GWP09_01025 [Nitrospiraceae bacterium]|nr:hypothetical protein [Nitrospiraceae bacterium]